MGEVIKANRESIEKAYNELYNELKDELENKKVDLDKTEIEIIKYDMKSESYCSLVDVENRIEECNENSNEMLEKYREIKKEINILKMRIQYLELNRKSIFRQYE